jgi:hypothetical protein
MSEYGTEKLLLSTAGLYWVNPLAWALRALAINEFSSPVPEYEKTLHYPPGPRNPLVRMGDVYLINLGFYTDRAWIWYGVGYLLGLWVVLLLATTLAMHYIRWAGTSTAVAAEVGVQGGEGDEENPPVPGSPRKGFSYSLLQGQVGWWWC